MKGRQSEACLHSGMRRMDRSENEIPDRMATAWRRHERQWRDNRYVYAVVSRRSRGVSIGLNLNPGKACNFDCMYCQVDRRIPGATARVNLKRLKIELDAVLRAERDGSLYKSAPFDVLNPAERGVRDIAFSGDGEPTLSGNLEEAARIAANARLEFGLDSAKLVLLTNATRLNRPSVRAALELLDANNGEIWAKLDAGTEEYFRTVNRSGARFAGILDNILGAARTRPVVIQSLWFRIGGARPPDEEVLAYCGRLSDLKGAGGQIKTVQIHTVARDPADIVVSPLTSGELDRIASAARSSIAAPVEVFYPSHCSDNS
jgi:pyruvate-formate lyase-activating enzyme